MTAKPQPIPEVAVVRERSVEVNRHLDEVIRQLQDQRKKPKLLPRPYVNGRDDDAGRS